MARIDEVGLDLNRTLKGSGKREKDTCICMVVALYFTLQDVHAAKDTNAVLLNGIDGSERRAQLVRVGGAR